MDRTERPDHHERRRSAAARARERLASLAEGLRQRDGPPRPGDLFTLGGHETCGVRWAILAPAGHIPSTLLTVPADSCPLRGVSDVPLGGGRVAVP
jgi:hypothetical protein